MRMDELAGEWIYSRLSPWMRTLGVQVLYEPRGEGEKQGQGEESKNEHGGKVGGEKRFGHIVPRGVRLGLAKKMAAKSAAAAGSGKGKGKGKGRGGVEVQEEVVRWEMCRVNPLLRFLKYGPGQFFQRNMTPPPTTTGPLPVAG